MDPARQKVHLPQSLVDPGSMHVQALHAVAVRQIAYAYSNSNVPALSQPMKGCDLPSQSALQR